MKELLALAAALSQTDMEPELIVDTVFSQVDEYNRYNSTQIDGYEVWNDDDTELIGIQLNDEVIYFKEVA